MANVVPQADILRESLAEVVQAAKVPAKRRGAPIKSTVETLASECYGNGVLPDALTELIDLIVAPSHLDQASLNSLIKNLYPVTRIDGDIIIKVVGCLGHGALKPSLAIQAALLRWIIMVYHTIEKQDILSKVYAVLFNLLDTAAIRLALSRQTGNDPALTGLLRVFKDYYPEIIVGDATRGKASSFKHPDPQWRERLDEIQQAHARSLEDRDQPKDAFRVARHINNAGQSKRPPVVPEVHTSHAQENSVTLEEIENVDGLVKALETVELPNQLISVLGDPLLQKLMLLKPDPISHLRISNWLDAYGQDVLDGGDEGAGEVASFLEILQQYAANTKNLPPIVLSFFASYLKTWNGHDSRDCILQTLMYTPVPTDDFPELYSRILSLLEIKVLNGTAGSQLVMLKYYNGLLQHWITILQSDDVESLSTGAVSDLVTHVNKLCLTVVQTSSSTAAHSIILDFYEQAAYLASNPRLNQHIRIVIPPTALVYTLHFSSSPVTLSRLCGVLAQYKEGFQAATGSSRSSYPPEYINVFNGFLMDICNCLWRSRAFNAKDSNSHACLMPDNVIRDLATHVSAVRKGSELTSLFTLSTSSVLGSLATAYLRELEELEMEQGTGDLDLRHAGPVTRKSLVDLGRNGGVSLTWDEYRQGVLGYLEQQGMTGVGRLMHNTMTTLMKRS
ncbi:hypothetical protein JX266_001750 [Neoarthrinium moseri]|uniref:uncharacterized protein n=1 Tax=Neoarthrinium moseri TaxID=1658444 RepID=UPI001FDDC947|nr:uncharacterized protein JN550_009464 [Neoarthrinium moseri]KAI1853766.1 hypothetical protein JX266_001750 [Neoarthrinium moseri]KAI1863764.1 hypothetical protein JN550_009464 [Neoarthrinium moseri]